MRRVFPNPPAWGSADNTNECLGPVGGRILAGHAPEFMTPSERLARWMGSSSDLRISLYMLVLAIAVAAVLFLLNQRLFA